MQPTRNAIGETFYYSSPIPNEFFEIILCGTTPPNAAYSVHRSAQAIYVMEYVLSGKGAIDCGDAHFEVTAGDFYFLRKGASVHYYADARDPFSKIWINFRGRLIDELTDVYGIREDVIVRHQADGRIRDAITAIHACLGATDGTDLEAVRECSVRMMEVLSIAMRPETLEHGQQPVSMAEKIRQYIEMQLYEDITLADIAAYFNLHEVYAIRLFRERYGVTPIRYLGRRRIEVACRMIEEGRMSIKEIAAALHYSDGAYFSGRFKKEMGVSPSEYREGLTWEQNSARKNTRTVDNAR